MGNFARATAVVAVLFALAGMASGLSLAGATAMGASAVEKSSSR